jgi:hypothetical protein
MANIGLGSVKASNVDQRKHLKLRQRPTGEWEVYASIHGTMVFRWWIISESTMFWYKANFPEIPFVDWKENE